VWSQFTGSGSDPVAGLCEHCHRPLFFSLALQPLWALTSDFQFHDHFTDGRTNWTSDQPVARLLPKHRTTQTQNKHIHIPNIHALCGIRTHDPGFLASEDSTCLRPLCYRDLRHKPLGSTKVGEFVASWVTVSFSMRTVIHGVPQFLSGKLRGRPRRRWKGNTIMDFKDKRLLIGFSWLSTGTMQHGNGTVNFTKV
jgi:hypothetical protein